MAAAKSGSLLNKYAPSLEEGEEYLHLYADTPELSYSGEAQSFDAALGILRPDLALADRLGEIFCDRATWLGIIPRDIIRSYISPMVCPAQRRSLANGPFVTRIVDLVEDSRRGRIYAVHIITALENQSIPDRIREYFGSRKRYTYVKYEDYGKQVECYFHRDGIVMVAEPICVLPCGLFLCFDSRDDVIFLLDVETGQSVLLSYPDQPFPIGCMVDDFGEEFNVLT